MTTSQHFHQTSLVPFLSAIDILMDFPSWGLTKNTLRGREGSEDRELVSETSLIYLVNDAKSKQQFCCVMVFYSPVCKGNGDFFFFSISVVLRCCLIRSIQPQGNIPKTTSFPLNTAAVNPHEFDSCSDHKSGWLQRTECKIYHFKAKRACICNSCIFIN